MTMFAVGDVVVCVDVSPCRHCGDRLKIHSGRIYRVSGAIPAVSSSFKGEALFLAGVNIASPNHPTGKGGVNAARFRKIQKADDQFIEQVKACRPRHLAHPPVIQEQS